MQHGRTWVASLTLIVALAFTSRALQGAQAAAPDPPLGWQFSAGG